MTSTNSALKTSTPSDNDQNIKAVVGQKVLSFLNLYLDNHHVLMDKEDGSKMTTIIEWGILLADKKMLFRLKNTSATRQRLVD